MLKGKGCQELSQLRDLAASHDATVLEDVPVDVHTCTCWRDGSCEGGGNHMACLKLFAGLMQPVPQL
jgi:hypothetical protein